MLIDLEVNDILELRNPHVCGSYRWRVVRLGAEIRMECLGCGRRVMLTRRKLARRVKKIIPRSEPDES